MATEKRLIDANALLEDIKFEHDRIMQDPEVSNNMKWCEAVCNNRATEAINRSPTVDAVEAADMREFAEDVVYQFGYYTQKGGRLHITHGGLSTLEHAFDILGWENPRPVPECECEIEGCHEHATCGVPTADGYKRMCGKHYAKMDGDGNG
jgi:hypothetical protein